MSRESIRFRDVRVKCVFLILACLAAPRLFAQVDTGSILGTVKDQSGAVVPGAKVVLTNEETSFSVSTVSQNDGTYVFTPVKIGTYALTAEFAGFQKVTRPHITVNIQQQVVVDFNLVPGAVTQTIEVTTAPPLLQTQSGSVGEVVGSREVNDLPLNGRNYTFLAQLTAGVNTPMNDNRGLAASGEFAANGTRPQQNNYLLDGIDNNSNLMDFLNGTNYVVGTPVDAISEFKVQTSDYSAEIGRGAGAVLNATIKSGTNAFHGTAWEFLRNDKFDAADFFENAGGRTKGEFRRNQFGFAMGGPVDIPHLYNGKGKTFWFFDYEGTRIRQGTLLVKTVPTLAERASGYTNFTDLIPLQSGTRTDLLGRTFPLGTIFDPATTRSVTSGVADPVTGLRSTGTGFVRDPISCNGVANTICSNRISANAVNLLNLLPPATGPGLLFNFATNPVVKNTLNSFDTRVDHNFSERDQFFARVSYNDNPVFRPAPFQGFADGGSFSQGDEHDNMINNAASWTHSFSPTLITENRIGFSRIASNRLQAFGNTMGIPAKFGIPGIPQVPGNGGLPILGIGNVSQMGGAAWLISTEYSSTVQYTGNLSKVYGGHTFKGGFEFQHMKFTLLQPPWPRGEFDFNGPYASIPNNADSSTGIAQFLIPPIPATVPNGVDNVGGPNSVFASAIANIDDGRNYYGAYFQDDWKVTSKLTLNLGLRWEHFGQPEENFGGHANLIRGTPFSGAQYLIPVERKNEPLSPSFTSTLARDGIALVYSTNPALVEAQKLNWAPRFGFAYRVKPKLVVRGGYGIFYGGFENLGGGDNIGNNYPFEFSFQFFEPDDAHPIVYPDGNPARLDRGLLDIPLNPLGVNAAGLALAGRQFRYITPYTQSLNFMTQYQLTGSDSIELGYVGSLGRHLEVQAGGNHVSQILPPGTNPQLYVPFQDFARDSAYAMTEGNSYYNSLQFKYTRKFGHGLDFLGTYTWSKTLSDAIDIFTGSGEGSTTYRAPDLPGFGVQQEYKYAEFDIRQVMHFSGGYELPVGRGQRFMTNSYGLANALLGGWKTNWILTLQDGQPDTLGCTIPTVAGMGCYALLVPGQNRLAGKHNVDQWVNPAAFTNPAPATAIGQKDYSPLGGRGAQIVGPGFHRLDWSLFKEIKTSEKTHLEFRFEVFNLTNHPNFGNIDFSAAGFFAPPGVTDFTNPSNFAKISSTRDSPNDPRQIQFALKFYF